MLLFSLIFCDRLSARSAIVADRVGIAIPHLTAMDERDTVFDGRQTVVEGARGNTRSHVFKFSRSVWRAEPTSLMKAENRPSFEPGAQARKLPSTILSRTAQTARASATSAKAFDSETKARLSAGTGSPTPRPTAWSRGTFMSKTLPLRTCRCRSAAFVNVCTASTQNWPMRRRKKPGSRCQLPFSEIQGPIVVDGVCPAVSGVSLSLLAVTLQNMRCPRRSPDRRSNTSM